MALVLILAVLVVVLVGRWAWHLHLRALEILGLDLAPVTGAAGPATMAEVVSVLVDADTVLVGLRARSGPLGGAPTDRTPVSTVVVSVEDQGCGPVARLERWQASRALLLVWGAGGGGAIEFCQRDTGQRVRLPIVTTSAGGVTAHASRHSAGRRPTRP